jgi:hypothetical protein
LEKLRKIMKTTIRISGVPGKNQTKLSPEYRSSVLLPY